MSPVFISEMESPSSDNKRSEFCNVGELTDLLNMPDHPHMVNLET